MTRFADKLASIDHHGLVPTLAGNLRGIEKESLRVTPDGHLATTPHPQALGSALTHPSITTDYSEALLEFITPVCSSIDEALGSLTAIHHYTYQHIGDEMLWVNSMPCLMGEDSDIPIAQYGTSNIGRMKTVYRVGLGLRYGRRMQTIAGIHYNFSIAEAFWPEWQRARGNTDSLRDFISAEYFVLIRNFRRHVWLLVYLFGASPAICKSFIRGLQNVHWLQEDEEHSGTLYRQYGTSLRMSDIGYQNNAQAGLNICYNSLDGYIETLTDAIRTPHKPYEMLGVQNNGEWRQLNGNILQIENEYYSDIRPKRVAQSGERPTLALKRHGVQYVEMRCVDLNPFEPIGINDTTAAFLETFAVWCLLGTDDELDDDSCRLARDNLKAAVLDARKPGFALRREDNSTTELRAWADDLFVELTQVAKRLAQATGDARYITSVEHMHERLHEPDRTPSARVLQSLAESDSSFFDWAYTKAEEHRRHFTSLPLDPAQQALFARFAAESLAEQREIESSDTLAFADFVAAYFAGDD